MANETPLIHDFVISGDIVGVLGELAKGVDVDARDPTTDRTPLMEAVSSPKATIDMVRLLIERGANVNAVACDRSLIETQEHLKKIAELAGDTQNDVPVALRLKAATDAIESLKNSAQPGEDGRVMKENVLSRAVKAGDLQKVKVVLDAGADVRYERPHKYNVLIDAMCSFPHGSQLVPILQLLIDRGAELNTVNPYRESALSVSSNWGRFDAIRVLLAAGADSAPLEWTPLMRAVALGSVDDVKAEIENGADLTARDFWDRTA